jgi:hypothetical protein
MDGRPDRVIVDGADSGMTGRCRPCPNTVGQRSTRSLCPDWQPLLHGAGAGPWPPRGPDRAANVLSYWSLTWPASITRSWRRAPACAESMNARGLLPTPQLSYQGGKRTAIG